MADGHYRRRYGAYLRHSPHISLMPAAEHAQAEQIEELKRSTQFPKLTPTSPEFLTLMEEYVREVRSAKCLLTRSSIA